ncbi:unnamed protein product [Nippostrongylus brasiliensis]|uniref:CACTA en-spm transposon protein n=1 Tax=Nippostrongylus brasiliensis TaxID=27835 RepID=A0A0N4Y5J8_NIPBR|nr:unnamed protein product [Nippostrongylus brasiliensis]
MESAREEMKKYPLSMLANADQTGINKKDTSTSRCENRNESGAVYRFFLTLLHRRIALWSLASPQLTDDDEKDTHNDQIPGSQLHRERVAGSSGPPFTNLLVDSWAGFRDHTNVVSQAPHGKEVWLMSLPAGATSLCQPTDAYFFRLFKRYIRQLHNHVIQHHPEFNVSSPDNILKVRI